MDSEVDLARADLVVNPDRREHLGLMALQASKALEEKQAHVVAQDHQGRQELKANVVSVVLLVRLGLSEKQAGLASKDNVGNKVLKVQLGVQVSRDNAAPQDCKVSAVSQEHPVHVERQVKQDFKVDEVLEENKDSGELMVQPDFRAPEVRDNTLYHVAEVNTEITSHKRT